MAPSDRIDELKKRYDENPRRFFASLANEFRKAGDLEHAIALCESHLAEQPSNMNGHVVYGQALYEAGRYDEAKVTFETALQLDPENLIALRHLGDIACTNGENEQARIWYERVLDADPRNDEIIALLATLAEESKKTKASEPESSQEPEEAVETTEAAAPGEGRPSAKSMEMREARTVEFVPPTRNTPLSTPQLSVPTPITPIEAVTTLKTPAVSAPVIPPAAPTPPRESIGLLDLSIDFSVASELTTSDATPTVVTPAFEHAPDAAHDGSLHDEFPEFEEISLGTPISSAPAADAVPEPEFEPLAEVTTASSPVEMEEWNPPVVDLHESVEAPAAPAPATPAAANEPMDVEMLFGDTLPAEPAAPFVTETMAELYMQQGFTAEALEVYRQLAAMNPDDEAMKERVARLERGDSTSVSSAPVIEPAPGALEGAVPIGAMAYDETPVVAQSIVAVLEEPPAAPEPPAALEPEAPAEPEPMPLSARSYFAGLSARRAVQGNGRMRTPFVPTQAIPATPAAAPAMPTPATAMPRVSGPVPSLLDTEAAPVFTPSRSSIDGLFDTGTIAAEDEHIALAFAQVAGAVEMSGTSVKGKPTAPASSELSLDSVFRESETRATGTISRQSQTLRFDQFFSATPAEPTPVQPPTAAPTDEPGSPAELQQFQSWLTGLKKP